MFARTKAQPQNRQGKPPALQIRTSRSADRLVQQLHSMYGDAVTVRIQGIEDLTVKVLRLDFVHWSHHDHFKDWWFRKLAA